MNRLTIAEKGKRVILSGNEAIARGALEAGIGFASTYPGTPVSGVGDSLYKVKNDLAGLHFEYSTNEKVAFEGAIGAAWCGIRAMCSMKLPGVNVAADPLHSVCYFGVKGLVLINGGDPGIQSSATEQDNRWYALHAHFPVLEPSTVQEAKDFTKLAFEISEKSSLPCMINIPYNLCFTQASVDLGDLPGTFPEREEFRGPDVKNTIRSLEWHKALFDKERMIADVYGGSELNTILKGKRDWGIITSGLNFGYTMEALDQLSISDASILKLGLVYPLSAQVLEAFCKDLEKVIIIEELEPFIETHVKKIGFEKKLETNIVGKEMFPPWGCLSTTLVTRILSRHLKLDLPTELKELDERKIQDRGPLMDVPERVPTLCSGCPHRGSAYAVRKATKGKAVYGSEIGCYSLLRQAPWKLTDYGICMGAGIGISQGMSHKLKGRPLVAFIGDSSLFHSGLPAVLNAAYYDAEVLLIVLDNRWTAMTGHQPIPNTGMDVSGELMNTIPVEQVLKGLGAKKIWFSDPFKPEEMAKTVSLALKESGFRVIISQGECILQTQRRERLQGTFEKKEFVIDQKRCEQCGVCYNQFKCPAIIKRSEGDQESYSIDSGFCVGCQACVDICHFEAISELGRN